MFQREHGVNNTYNHSPGIHDKNLVRIHNCVQTVGNRENGAVLELPSYRLLYKSVGPATSKCIAVYYIYIYIHSAVHFSILFDHFVDGGDVVIGSTCCGPNTAFVVFH